MKVTEVHSWGTSPLNNRHTPLPLWCNGPPKTGITAASWPHLCSAPSQITFTEPTQNWPPIGALSWQKTLAFR